MNTALFDQDEIDTEDFLVQNATGLNINPPCHVRKAIVISF